MGRVWTEDRMISGGGTKSISYTYLLDGSISTLAYPSTGKTITYSYSRAGRPLSALNTTDNVNYVQSATYAAPGELTAMTNGATSTFAGISVQNSYNKRLQPLQAFRTTGTTLTSSQLAMTTCPGTVGTIMHHVYGFGAGTNDNGNVQSMANCRDTNRTENFAYDSLNRILNASTNGPNWGETYTIDAWGNMTAIGSYQSKPHESLSTSASTNNQLIGFSYDAAGNMIQNGSPSYTYDGENRLTSTVGWTYTYDGDGVRVKKCASSCTTGTLYWGGGTLSESDLAGNIQHEYIYFGGARVARRDVSGNTVHYYFSNHLGSSSVVTNATGSTPFDQEIDYYPFGGEIDISNNLTQNYKFSGKERDAESGLDNFGARYNASSLGRFMTPDWSARPITVPYAVFGDPQSLNLYGFVRNDPVSSVDADGHFQLHIGESEQCSVNNRCAHNGSHDGPSSLLAAMLSSMGGIHFNDVMDSDTYSPFEYAVQYTGQNTINGVPAECSGCTSEKKAAIAAEKAAVAKTKDAAKRGKTEEWGGWIITKDGKNFTYTVPVTFHDSDHFYNFSVTVPDGYAQAAAYHTHPDPGSWGEGFSPADMRFANYNQMNIYVGMSYSGNVRQYVPGKTKDNGLNGVSGDLIYTMP